jgi:hypothetical protein
MDATPLAKRLFTVFDADNSGTVDKIEFIMGMRSWAVKYSLREKLDFAFKIYGVRHDCMGCYEWHAHSLSLADLNGDGHLEPHELFLVLVDTNQGWRNEKLMKKIMTKVTKWVQQKGLKKDIHGRQRITMSEFREVANKFPSSILLPLIGLIEKLFTGMDVGTLVIPGATCCCGICPTRPFD